MVTREGSEWWVVENKGWHCCSNLAKAKLFLLFGSSSATVLYVLDISTEIRLAD